MSSASEDCRFGGLLVAVWTRSSQSSTLNNTDAHLILMENSSATGPPTPGGWGTAAGVSHHDERTKTR